MPVRSKRLFGPVNIGTSTTLLYTCPAGETALIKQLDIFNQGAVQTLIRLFLNGTDASSRTLGRTVDGTTSLNLTGFFMVLHPGDEIYGSCGSGNVTFTGYGSELEGVAD